MDLMMLLPDYYENNETMRILQGVISDETENLEQGLTDTVDQCFPVTASNLLERWERVLGLEVDASKTPEFRRERILAKISGAGTTTKAMIVDTASRYSNGAVEVIEDNTHYRFTVKFVGTLGIPGNMADLKLTIEEIKPAHLAVDYEYVYNTWSDVGSLTWEQAAGHTWKEIRTVRI